MVAAGAGTEQAGVLVALLLAFLEGVTTKEEGEWMCGAAAGGKGGGEEGVRVDVEVEAQASRG